MEFDKAVAELGTLVETLEREGDERALMLLQLIDAIHRPALEAIAAGDLDAPAAQAVLAMYGLAELEPEELVEEALDRVRPYIHSHGGEVELLEVSGGKVRLRMSGACHGCAASAMTLKRGIETAIRESWPGLEQVIAEEPEGAPGPQLLQIENVGEAKRPEFVAAGSTAEIEAGELRATEVDGEAVLLANVEGEIYAYRNACPTDGRSPLEGGKVSGSVLVCPWHNCAFDLRTGARVDDRSDAEPLAMVPVAISDGGVEVAVNVA